MEDIVIIGTGGFAKEVTFLIESINAVLPQWNILGYLSETEEQTGKSNGKYKIIGSDDWLLNFQSSINAVIAIGNPQIIEKAYVKFKSNDNVIYPNLIHPGVIGDWERIQLGCGNIICAGNFFTTDISIGSFNIFNLNCTIGHDSVIGSYNIFNPSVNLSGGVQIDDRILTGTGAQILQYLSITSDSIIGAGAVVARSISEPGTYTGIPAKKLEKR